MSQGMKQARKIDSIRTYNPILQSDAEINGAPCDHRTSDQEGSRISLLKRHETQVLVKAGHMQTEVAQIAGVSVRTVRQVAEEPEVESVDDRGERRARRVGRPSKVEEYREFVKELLEREPGLMSLEVLRRAREKRYCGGKTVIYELIAALRPLQVFPENLALRIPVPVSPTAEVYYTGRGYTMPAEAAGLPATVYLYRDRIHVVAGSYEAEHPRHIPKGSVSRLPEHRAAHLAAVSGARGKRYLKRQHLFETGEAAVEFLTELVHRYPRGWSRDVDELHGMLQTYGPEKMEQALRAATQAGIFSVRFIAQCLGYHGQPEHERPRCREEVLQ